MKKLFLITLFPFSCFSSPFIGADYLYTYNNHDYNVQYHQDNIKLSPDKSDSGFTLYGGFTFDENWEFELGYQKYKLDSSIEGNRSINNNVISNYEWDSKINVDRFYLMPKYIYSINDDIDFRIGAGLTYTDYKFSTSKSEEFESLINADNEWTTPISSHSFSKKRLGIISKFELNYKLPYNFSINTSALLHDDSALSSLSLTLGARYSF
ncbi:organic solvent ABC transporter substrate-binding protein [Vibrio cholerae]|uniref:AcfA family outer membrane beta-barrel protein n=1 Tax=Vibrio cholerae TaxID=666 RepID=UPI0011D6F09E|nr:AcfA family outer membrane beta-barrel protein [Vibrio cholerae]EKF9186536.1 AcfA family outer membrane beta-barrel protein [Vibrio cholerae]TYA72616.1 outer membrane beta-barrel protein [Vibrio cholerae]GHZ98818.1 organic solvent ABC transporter substrate-binding protein [Vibrio cholerae]GIB41554.1 organic solvent ABC transporter substrate-binding protein [Vibrio cholerae]